MEASNSIVIHLKGSRGIERRRKKRNKIRKNGKGNEKQVEKIRRHGNARKI